MDEENIIIQAMIYSKWEEAKGLLRSVVALQGSVSRVGSLEYYSEIKGVVEVFIKLFEENNYEELN